MNEIKSALERASQAAVDDARAKAEIQIEKILNGLEYETKRKLKTVEVDTDNFELPQVEITFHELSKG